MLSRSRSEAWASNLLPFLMTRLSARLKLIAAFVSFKTPRAANDLWDEMLCADSMPRSLIWGCEGSSHSPERWLWIGLARHFFCSLPGLQPLCGLLGRGL